MLAWSLKVILFEETLFQNADDGFPLVEILMGNGIVAGVKVDKGTKPLKGTIGGCVTQGLDDLDVRCAR